MALSIRHPIWLPAAPNPGVKVFALLYFIETFARASVVTVLPIQAYDLFLNKQAVSFTYTLVGITALAFSLIIPVLIKLFARRWVYTLGALSLVLAAICFAGFTMGTLITGMMARVIGIACLNVTLNLYVLDFINKQDYVKSDSVRVAFSVIGWTSAPYLGVWFYSNWGPEYAFGWSGACAMLLLCVFWYLRLSDNKIIQKAKTKPTNPLSNVKRFVSQPRLRLAWLISFGRSTFWTSLFIYGPLLMVTTGQGARAGALVVSMANMTILSVLVWAKIAGKIGVRRSAYASFLLSGLTLLLAGYYGEAAPWFTASILIFTALLMCALDAVGNVPFYRAVHPHERAEMTSVYRTYLDFGELLPPLIYGVLLGFFGLGSVFFALSALMFICSWYCWTYLNGRL